MNLLAQHWLLHSLGWTLLHFCWQGAVVATVLWCALQLLAGRPAQTRYLATCAALGLIVLLPLLTFIRVAFAEYRLHSAASVLEGSTVVVQPGLSGAPASWLLRLSPALEPMIPWLLMAYLLGSFFFLLRLSVGFGVARRMRRTGTSPAAPDLQAAFTALQHRLSIPRAVRLMTSALVQVPTVIGWLRPIVLLPVACFTGLSAAQIEVILCHELAHIRRHDYLVSVCQSIVEAVLFYHPAVWWISSQIRRERECCCDDLAVSLGGDALAYARALSVLEAQRSSYPRVILGANGGVLTMRIKRLLGYTDASTASQAAAVMILALLVVATIAIGTTARAESLATASSAPLSAPAAPALVVESAVESAAESVAESITPPPRLLALIPQPAVPALPADARAMLANEPQEAVPVKVAGGIIAGQIVLKTQPLYPADARAAHISGAVVMRAIISKTGDIAELSVISGPGELRASAHDAVLQWKYKPYLLNGQPTEVETTITVNYSFGGGPSDQTAQNTDPQASATTPKMIGNGVKAPILIFSPDPSYTEVARANKIAGQVLVNLWVDEQGNPTHVKVAKGIGYGLDEKAVEAVQHYRFKPASENGTPVVVSMNVEIDFQLF